MHELGICDALLKMVDGIARDEGLACVRKVTVEVGSLSGVVPAYLADCWDAVTDGTPYQSAAFAVETLPGVAQCIDCGEKFTADIEKLVCPRCGGKKLTPLTGRELMLKEIEAD